MSNAMAPMAEQKRASRLRRSTMPPTTRASRSGTPTYEPFSTGESKTMCQLGVAQRHERVAQRGVAEGEVLVDGRDDEAERVDGDARDGRGRLGRTGDVLGPGHGQPGAVADAQRDHDDRAPGEGHEPPPVERHVLPQRRTPPPRTTAMPVMTTSEAKTSVET